MLPTTQHNMATQDYSSNPADYTRLVEAILDNEILASEVAKMKMECPEVINLVDINWEENLTNNAIVKEWKNDLKFTELTPISEYYRISMFPHNRMLKVMVAADVFYYGASRKSSENYKKPGNKKIDITSAPIELLLKEIKKMTNKEYHNYMSVLLPQCNDIHTICCTTPNEPMVKRFCVQGVKFFNGSEAACATPAFFKKKRLMRMLCVAVIRVQGIVSFKEKFNFIKLNGIAENVLFTTKSCFKAMINPNEQTIFDARCEEDESPPDENPIYLLPDKIVPDVSGYQVATKKIKLT